LPDTVIVTGAAGALGRATVSAFLEAGFDVVGLDRDAAVVDVATAGYRGLQLDVTDEDAVDATLGDLHDSGRLRHLVQVAGGALPEEPATQHDPQLLSPDLFRRSVEANLTSQYVVLRAALPWLRSATGTDRSVTLISSWNALSAQGMPAYSAAKAGLIGMMHALVWPLGREGVRINVVAPGTIRTPRTERIWAHDVGHFERLADTAAIGRLGEPDDVAATCLALATTLTHVCGQVLVVDGGQSAHGDGR
jgi:NAD(P)-dependent dehydrogenase (short-subunit alcohol dehydrogenase family)